MRNHQQIQILRKTKIGYGLYIGHGGPVVVNPSTVIGNNCNLSQFVTIGSNEGKAAVIGDNVYIGPNTCIVEDVSIGDNATIGAGSVVTKDIPSNATAAGNYAKVLISQVDIFIIDIWNSDSKSGRNIMKNILFVMPSLGSGGAEKSLVNLLNLIDYEKYPYR